MLIFEAGAHDSNFGKMVCHWEEDAALMYVRRAIEQARCMFNEWGKQSGAAGANETEAQRALDD